MGIISKLRDAHHDAYDVLVSLELISHRPLDDMHFRTYLCAYPPYVCIPTLRLCLT